MSTFKAYWNEIIEGIQSTRKGMALTWKHAWAARKSRENQQIQEPGYFDTNEGIFTLQYPHQQIPTPVNGRYQLHNEMDDCIVCDKCVKVCPVDCIDIEPIKATGLVGHTSDGSPIRLYAAKFDIDMAKCCFCGLCTTVCPTECLTMTSEYDFSVFDIKEHNFAFGNLSPEEAEEKKRLYEQFVAEKEALKAAAKSTESADTSHTESTEKPVAAKPAFKPSFKPKMPSAAPVPEKDSSSVPASEKDLSASQEMKAEEKPSEVDSKSADAVFEKPAAVKPAFKPSFKPKIPPKPPTDA
jgi:formate hydrogenlyase subunit 6/NADH:ubiquinone oxidoreductase subunit I